MKLIVRVILLYFYQQIVHPANIEPCQTAWKYFNLTRSCYFTGHYETFKAAESTCTRNNAHISSIHSKEENEFLNGLYTTAVRDGDEKDMTWIGLRHFNHSWFWTDNSQLDYTNWGEEPRQLDSKCVVQRGAAGWRLRWQQVDCELKVRKYVCKKPARI